MLSHLEFLFLPHERNNHKPKVLHLSSLFLLVLFIGAFQLALTLITRLKPGILGFASNIPSEKIIALTNERRVANGAVPVQLNAALSEAARQKAAEMFTFGCWSHNCNNRTPWWFIRQVGYEYLYAGENLAKDFADPDSIVNAWMNSPTHKENLLNGKYKEVGIAVVDGVLNGEETTLVVQMFGTPAKAPSIATAAQANQAPAKVAEVKGQEEKPVEIAQQPSVSIQTPEELIVRQAPAVSPKKQSWPIISSFRLTKIFYLTLVLVLIIVLALDTAIISHKQIVRISGKSFVHLSFFMIILISILLSCQGKIN